MARPRKNPADIATHVARVAEAVGEATEQDTEPRSRSKRGIVLSDTSQICFRIEKDRHRALRMYCVEHDMEIGEVLDGLISKHLKI